LIVTPLFALWKAAITVWSKVCWKVEPEPLSVVLPDPPPLFELLPHAARMRTGATSATTVRRKRWDRIVAIKVEPFVSGVLVVATLRTKDGRAASPE
jgi:hypothetical protein